MVRFKLGDEAFTCPEDWSELTLDSFIKLKRCDITDEISVLSAITGIEYDKLFACNVADLDNYLMPKLKFLTKKVTYADFKKPTHLEFNGIKYKVPDNLEEYTLGQKIALSKRMKKEYEQSKDLDNCLAFAVSCYMAPIVTGKPFSSKLAEEFEPSILNLTMDKVYPIGGFFLMRLIESETKKSNYYLINRRKSRLWRALVNLIYLGKPIQLIH